MTNAQNVLLAGCDLPGKAGMNLERKTALAAKAGIEHARQAGRDEKIPLKGHEPN